MSEERDNKGQLLSEIDKMTPLEEDKNAAVVRLEDGTAYPLDGYVKVLLSRCPSAGLIGV